MSLTMSVCLYVFESVPKNLTNLWTDIVLFYSKASFKWVQVLLRPFLKQLAVKEGKGYWNVHYTGIQRFSTKLSYSKTLGTFIIS